MTTGMDTEAVLDLVRDVAEQVVVPRFRSLDAGDVSEKGPGDLVTIADRHLVLAYGSNLDPLKLQDKLLSHAGGELYAISAAVYGWGAVWCAVRRSDGSCTATLVPYPDSVEVHAVLAVTRIGTRRTSPNPNLAAWARSSSAPS